MLLLCGSAKVLLKFSEYHMCCYLQNQTAAAIGIKRAETFNKKWYDMAWPVNQIPGVDPSTTRFPGGVQFSSVVITQFSYRQ